MYWAGVGSCWWQHDLRVSMGSDGLGVLAIGHLTHSQEVMHLGRILGLDLTSLNVAFLICKVGTAVLLIWLGIVSIKWAEWKVLSSVPGTCGHSWGAAILSLPLGLSDLTAPAEFTPLHSRSRPNLLPRHSLSTLFYLCFFHSDLSQIVKCKLLSVHP